MNRLDFFINIYGKLNNYSFVPYWVLTLPRRIVRRAAGRMIPHYLLKRNNYIDGEKSEIIVSFTSFPTRINNVWQVVECMKRQTLKPAKILLWLSKEQFPTPESIPCSLKKREDDIFEIRMVDGDIRSYKKYYYVACEFPDRFIFLIDDDLYYPTNILKKTWDAHLEHPGNIICNYGYQMNYHPDGTVKSYKEWTQVFGDSDDDNLFFGSGGGTLIVPSNMHESLTNIDLALKLTPIADDIWLNTMARLAGIKKHMIAHGLLLPIGFRDNVRLTSDNNGQNKNDEQLDQIRKYYANTSFGDPYKNY